MAGKLRMGEYQANTLIHLQMGEQVELVKVSVPQGRLGTAWGVQLQPRPCACWWSLFTLVIWFQSSEISNLSMGTCVILSFSRMGWTTQSKQAGQ